MILSFQTRLNTPSFIVLTLLQTWVRLCPPLSETRPRAKNGSFHALGPAARLKLSPWNQMWRSLNHSGTGHFLCSFTPRLPCGSLWEQKKVCCCLCWGKCVWCLKSSSTWRSDPDPDEWSRLSGFSATASAVIHLQSVLLVLPVAFRVW